MIRQRRNKANLHKSWMKIQNVLQSQEVFINKDNIKNDKVFEDGVFNKFFKININNRSFMSYTNANTRYAQKKSQKPLLCIRGQNINESLSNKQNFSEDEFSRGQNQQKMVMLQTTGNSMLSFKRYKRKQNESKQKRPMSAVNSYRESMKSQSLESSLSRVLEELNKNDITARQKISTSQALVLFSKVMRQNENPSRQLFKRRIKTPSTERYKSVSIFANKIKMQKKVSMQRYQQQKQKIDFKSYLKRFNLMGKKGQKNKQRQQDYKLKGWETQEMEGF